MGKRYTRTWTGEIRKEVGKMPTNTILKRYRNMNDTGRMVARETLKDRGEFSKLGIKTKKKEVRKFGQLDPSVFGW